MPDHLVKCILTDLIFCIFNISQFRIQNLSDFRGEGWTYLEPGVGSHCPPPQIGPSHTRCLMTPGWQTAWKPRRVGKGRVLDHRNVFRCVQVAMRCAIYRAIPRKFAQRCLNVIFCSYAMPNFFALFRATELRPKLQQGGLTDFFFALLIITFTRYKC